MCGFDNAVVNFKQRRFDNARNKRRCGMVSGTMAAVVPMEEPTSIRVSGIMATIKIINGVERVALTITPSTELITAFGRMCPLRVTVRMMPSGMPIRLASTVEATTM